MHPVPFGTRTAMLRAAFGITPTLWLIYVAALECRAKDRKKRENCFLNPLLILSALRDMLEKHLIS